MQGTSATQNHVKMAPSASGIIRGWMATDANALLILQDGTVKVIACILLNFTESITTFKTLKKAPSFEFSKKAVSSPLRQKNHVHNKKNMSDVQRKYTETNLWIFESLISK